MAEIAFCQIPDRAECRDAARAAIDAEVLQQIIAGAGLSFFSQQILWEA
jgi:hypothetical protein